MTTTLLSDALLARGKHDVRRDGGAEGKARKTRLILQVLRSLLRTYVLPSLSFGPPLLL